MQIFNNWNIVAKGWYIACPSNALSNKQTKSVEICGQKIAIFRGEDGKVRALDAYCPHLGTDLGIGNVEGNLIRCAFHHWAFDETGICQNIPCQSEIPQQAKIQAYATEEKYGFIWIYPEAKAPEGVADFDELKDKEIIAQADKAFERSCHHHICMMNGIDAQHLKTIHHLDIKMDLSLHRSQLGTQIDFTMRGQFPQTTWRERLGKKFLGSSYEYSMRYADGCIGLLTMMKKVKLFPPLHMLYAYTPIAPGKTRIQPIYVTAKRRGIGGYLLSRFLLLCTRWAYYMLRDEDGKIYDNIRFQPKLLLSIDRPLAQYIEYVNQLEPSRWSVRG
ncbi:aromatic ring-hydroxylating dioxygenase subunit alpha [Calothrix sp. FACHB-1219]|uniref:aromatic ring-hydroxylating oxygenase subunit alpha n=1 Tax=unclassified Calothrix TaxID=2619626 RepID=UPI0016881A89|nr:MULTISPECIES: aromatic ring-hydroxylating dioxygenase subunit alpha [unclassified Calothrix]MBD2207498.1 aromatic ring-hydroxylating dioxygenase subunit alpha [Calothrix sp. FACHB-168]MBD2222099.1 aromatic ring-hydroxylating dioxygenase subunit alpha [Calothrix sp. FACHB-1219]